MRKETLRAQISLNRFAWMFILRANAVRFMTVTSGLSARRFGFVPASLLPLSAFPRLAQKWCPSGTRRKSLKTSSDLIARLLNRRIFPVKFRDIRETSQQPLPTSRCSTRKCPPLSRCPRMPQPKLTSLNNVPSILAIRRATGSITKTPAMPTRTCSTCEGGW